MSVLCSALKVSPLRLILMVVALVIGGWEVRVGVGELSARVCKEERRLAINECKPVLYGKLPTPQCCQRVRVSHVDCICPVITPKLAALIDVGRAVRLVEGCGRRVPHHFKCGSITTP
ncbi:hypothetical protein NE237_025580 [Protea cynaroides]|uniref:Bifunctional inhibitor/plant lipid transfer protein/seed storage helical domain-containing protein n=1 Tax=Protea cynaroides TaxID=273540 RepID=A0A9Q0H3E9_9MAGN|nr:hypothetical protein NE237_025580 [Protea cynaroides]